MPTELKYKTTKSAGHMTYEEFLAWADEDTLAEWVNGEVQLRSSASAPHQMLSGFLSRILAQFAEDNDSGRVLAAPFQMKSNSARRGREPDLLFVAKENLGRFHRNFLDGPADLVVEIVSPESALRDRGEKYAEYEQEGIKEYWILDFEAQRADFFILGDDARYERRRPDANGRYESVVLPNFWLNVGWLWQSPLPTLRQVLAAWETN